MKVRFVLAAALVLAASACRVPFPGTTATGLTTSLAWVSNADPAEHVLVSAEQDQFFVYALRNVTRPAALRCAPGSDPLFARQCESYFEGTGFSVLVPDDCQTFAATEPAGLPDLELDVDGDLFAFDPTPNDALAATQTRNALYVTAAGAGTLTIGSYAFQLNFPLFAPTVEQTPRVPDRPQYLVALTCATGPGADPGTFSTVTYEGMVERDGFVRG